MDGDNPLCEPRPVVTPAEITRRLRREVGVLVCDDSQRPPEGIALYTLSDPRDVRAVRYVGQSRAPARRYGQHVRAACLWLCVPTPWWVRRPHLVPLYTWIRALHEDGARLPFMLVTHWVPALEQARALEQSLIAAHRAAGCALFNCEALRPPRSARRRPARLQRHLPAGADVGELGAEEENHGRVVHPHDHHDERAGGTVRRTDRRPPEVQTDQRLADGE